MSESKYQASPSDGKELLRILESSAAKGSIELVYTRRPDAYESYMKEAGEARVFVSKDGERTVGTCAELVRDVYIGGEKCKAAYVCGLKKDALYDGGIGFGAEFIRGLQNDDIDYYYCSVVSGNTEAQKMFENSSHSISMKPITEYKTYIFSPKVKIKSQKHSLLFRKATEDDIPMITEFLNAEGRKKDLFPVFTSPDQFYSLSSKDFYLLSDGNNILAAAALWNQTEYKQYIVKKYRGLMKLAHTANPLLSALKYITLPMENEPLDFPMLSFFVSRDDSEEYYRIFLSEITREISRSYGMFVIGLSKGHFAAPVLNKLPSISFETRLYEIKFPWSSQSYKTPDQNKIHPECGLL